MHVCTLTPTRSSPVYPCPMLDAIPSRLSHVFCRIDEPTAMKLFRCQVGVNRPAAPVATTVASRGQSAIGARDHSLGSAHSTRRKPPQPLALVATMGHRPLQMTALRIATTDRDRYSNHVTSGSRSLLLRSRLERGAAIPPAETSAVASLSPSCLRCAHPMFSNAPMRIRSVYGDLIRGLPNADHQSPFIFLQAKREL